MSHIRGIEAEAHCDQVHEPFVREHRGDHPHPAIRALRALVGRDRVRVVLVVADVVRAGDQAGAGHRVQQRAVRPDAVGADAGKHGGAKAEHAAVLPNRRAETDLLVARVVRRLQVLGSILDPFDSPVEVQADPRQQDLLGVDMCFETEATPDVGGDHANVFLV